LVVFSHYQLCAPRSGGARRIGVTKMSADDRFLSGRRLTPVLIENTGRAAGPTVV
jgi:hypothetical protein